MLCGLVEPRLFVRISRTPAHSSTARTGPPAITPVPVAAGLRRTRPAPWSPTISCGIVPPVSGTSIMRRRAASTALRTASLTSLALPVATPTRPCPSPTPRGARPRPRALGLLPRAGGAGRRGRGGGRGLGGGRGGRGGRDFALLICRHQNSNPPLRAPSARALTRPWYW